VRESTLYGRVEKMRDKPYKKSSDDAKVRFLSHLRIFSGQKIHESLFSGGYEGGKHGNSKILQVFYKYKA